MAKRWPYANLLVASVACGGSATVRPTPPAPAPTLPPASAGEPAPPGTVMLSATEFGGCAMHTDRCATYAIDTDGNVALTYPDGSGGYRMRLAPADVRDLQAQIDAFDPRTQAPPAATGTCAVEVDGTAHRYVFRTSAGTVHAYDGCQVEAREHLAPFLIATYAERLTGMLSQPDLPGPITVTGTGLAEASLAAVRVQLAAQRPAVARCVAMHWAQRPQASEYLVQIEWTFAVAGGTATMPAGNAPAYPELVPFSTCMVRAFDLDHVQLTRTNFGTLTIRVDD